MKITYNSKKPFFDKIKPKAGKLIHNLNGVYKIECPDCNKFYVGQTKKTFKRKIYTTPQFIFKIKYI